MEFQTNRVVSRHFLQVPRKTGRCIAILIAVATTLGAIAGGALAQAPDVAIEHGTPVAIDETAVAAANALRHAGKLFDRGQVQALLKAPRPAPIALPAPSTHPLPPSAVYNKAREAFLRLGWLCKISKDDPWQLDLAAGYAIADQGVVATAAHVMLPREDVHDAYLVAVTLDGRALPIKSVLALSLDLDTAIVRVEGFQGIPLALNDKVRPGDVAYCLSDPANERGYFSSGIINRFFWSDAASGDLKSLAGMKNLRLNVSTVWAPGSSGAAVLDEAGNAIGHVWSISEIGYPSEDSPVQEKQTPAAPIEKGDAQGDKPPAQNGEMAGSTSLLLLHTAIPARGIRMLAESMGPSTPKVEPVVRQQNLRRRWRFR